MRLKKTMRILLSVGVATALWVMGHAVTAQQEAASVLRDPYQRSTDIYLFQTNARSGPQRGEDIYYFKCALCHSQFAKAGSAGPRGPLLKGIFTRSNDQAVRDKILNGSPLVMPAYRHVLNETDVTDLVSYLKSDSCCYDFQSPPRNPRYQAAVLPVLPMPSGGAAIPRASLLGGARGIVRTAQGALLEGVAVQLISPRTAIRTTVYSNGDGRYEFPMLEPGPYTLRIARPLQFKPYVKESVAIQGAATLPEIVLERVNVVGTRPGREDSRTELLPPTPEILSQLTGEEWMMNLPGTAEEKRTIQLNCDHCHAWQQIFKARYDEAGWRIVLGRMMRGGGSPLINVSMNQPNAEGKAREDLLAKFLARVRGPDSKDPTGIATLPWPRGAATRVIVTEYELPRTLLAPHDLHGDSMGRIWYTAHRSPFSGMLDPRTGKVTEYRIPATQAEDTEGILSGTHRVWVDKKDVVWFSEQWDHFLTGVDARTGKQVRRNKLTEHYNLNSSGFSNFAFDDNGYAYETVGGNLLKINSTTGEVQKFKFPKQIQGTYDSTITPDGRYWSGADGNLIGLWDLKTGELWEGSVRTFVAGGRGALSRGGFDPDGNPWFGGSTGVIAKLDVKTKKITEYDPPVTFADFYEVMPDKNGEIWGGAVNAGKFVRFNPKTDKWTIYQLPEPYAHNRRTWIDSSTSPVTVWYVDNNGYIVRIQPLE